MKTLSLELPDELDQRLSTLAGDRHISKAELARQAIEAAVGAAPPAPDVPATENGEASGPSVYDLTKHVCGIAEGPGDLSFNPKYMEGFGR